mmetsp:Transcript_46697/g.129959  ORF Transcript_46697/g.129959 Transcript_46697/m.129959 type:complete len:316 (+) Transcript_46697:670-1617(+)
MRAFGHAISCMRDHVAQASCVCAYVLVGEGLDRQPLQHPPQVLAECEPAHLRPALGSPPQVLGGRLGSRRTTPWQCQAQAQVVQRLQRVHEHELLFGVDAAPRECARDALQHEGEEASCPVSAGLNGGLSEVKPSLPQDCLEEREVPRNASVEVDVDVQGLAVLRLNPSLLVVLCLDELYGVHGGCRCDSLVRGDVELKALAEEALHEPCRGVHKLLRRGRPLRQDLDGGVGQQDLAAGRADVVTEAVVAVALKSADCIRDLLDDVRSICNEAARDVSQVPEVLARLHEQLQCAAVHTIRHDPVHEVHEAMQALR